MKFMLNKQTGTFVLREDILDAIRMQAKSNAIANVTSAKNAKELENNFNKAKERMGSEIYKKTFLAFRDKGPIIEYIYEENKSIPTDDQVKEFIIFLKEQNSIHDSNEQALKDKYPFFALENFKDYIPQIEKDIKTIINYNKIEYNKKTYGPIFKARDNIETTFFGSKANSYLYEQKNIIPFLLLLAKKIRLRIYPKNLKLAMPEL